MLPWNDKAGRLSWFKLAVFIATLVPGLALCAALISGNAGAKPIEHAIHETGEWTIRFLLASLAITPLRRITQWPKLAVVRRMVGLTALAYGSAHLVFYIVEQNGDLLKVASEIALRIYLTIGFVALVGLIALGATSTDRAIRRLGKNWVKLHRISYAIAVLGVIHYFMQSKADVSAATLVGGLLFFEFACRLAVRFGRPLTSPWTMLVLAVLSGVATIGIEYAWYALATGIPPGLVFQANLDPLNMLRPAWWVFFVGLAATAATLWKSLAAPRLRAARTPAP